ncbi:MAG: ABC transporter ATP-binding protein [Gallionella sp.]|nr:ABC transporter ATP-binding protein [Gallionella sp.]
MNNIDFAIQLTDVSKKFRLYSKPFDRLKEALHPLKKKLHAEHWALHDISLSIRRGETVGIMGRNGAGKSTLLQLITSVLEPTAGEVCVNGRISALLELGAGFNPELTGRENVMAQAPLMGMFRSEMTARMPEIESFADIGEYIDQPVKTYSSGMFVRLAFSMSMSIDPDILIIDEALAVGDASFQEKCFCRLKEFKQRGKTFLIVSHAAGIIAELCDRVVVIEAGKVDFLGPPREAIMHYGRLLFGENGAPDDTRSLFVYGTAKGAELPQGNIEHDFISTRNTQAQEFHRAGYNKEERRSGNKKALIVDFMIAAGNRSDICQLEIGERIQVFIRALYQHDVHTPRVALSIHTPTGQLVYGSNNEFQGCQLESARAGEERFYRIEVDNILAPGNYFLSLYIVERSLTSLELADARESVVQLTVTGVTSFNGMADLKGTTTEIQPDFS